MKELEARVERLENWVEELEYRLNRIARNVESLENRIYDVKRDLEYDIYRVQSDIETVRREARNARP